MKTEEPASRAKIPSTRQHRARLPKTAGGAGRASRSTAYEKAVRLMRSLRGRRATGVRRVGCGGARHWQMDGSEGGRHLCTDPSASLGCAGAGTPRPRHLRLDWCLLRLPLPAAPLVCVAPDGLAPAPSARSRLRGVITSLSFSLTPLAARVGFFVC
jgi:hypothetical protein